MKHLIPFSHGSLDNPIENGGELHLPCAVLVDTSISMSNSMNQLYEGLVIMGEALRESPQALGRVEFCIITFDDIARIAVPFGPAYDYEAPRLQCGGRMTAMHEAIDCALTAIENRKAQYRRMKVPHYRPWIFMLTDGGANDEDNGAFQRLYKAQASGHYYFWPVAIGERADIELLESLQINGLVLGASKEDFKGAFTWLVQSVTVTSSTHGGDKVELPDPKNHHLTIIT